MVFLFFLVTIYFDLLEYCCKICEYNSKIKCLYLPVKTWDSSDLFVECFPVPMPSENRTLLLRVNEELATVLRTRLLVSLHTSLKPLVSFK